MKIISLGIFHLDPLCEKEDPDLDDLIAKPDGQFVSLPVNSERWSDEPIFLQPGGEDLLPARISLWVEITLPHVDRLEQHWKEFRESIKDDIISEVGGTRQKRSNTMSRNIGIPKATKAKAEGEIINNLYIKIREERLEVAKKSKLKGDEGFIPDDKTILPILQKRLKNEHGFQIEKTTYYKTIKEIPPDVIKRLKDL